MEESIPETTEMIPKNGNPNTRDDIVIWIRNAYMDYGYCRKKINVLMDLNMSIPRGAIYGLLGPSGCGKTTLLQCIVGKQHLKSGELLVYGYEPGSQGLGIPGGRVGYMPQELALYQEFSLKETLRYFGKIFRMSYKDIDCRMDFLIEFLDLPSKNRLIKQLSGGQQRRVSLAAALLHEPELLILDEPTVGVDPLLRQCIWDHLLAISNNPKKKTTIIITTHYIEEARQAHVVGMMRFGKLLAEDSPANLMRIYSKSTLEEVFFDLCVGDSNESNNDSLENKSSSLDLKKIYTNSDAKRPSKAPYLLRRPRICDSLIVPARLGSLLMKNFIRMWRNIGFLIFQFLLPTIQVSLFCLAIGRNLRDMSIAVVNNEVPTGVCSTFYKGCITEKHMGFFSPKPENDSTFLSCRYLSFVDQSVLKLQYFENFTEAIESVKSGKNWGVLLFKEEFTASFNQRMFNLVDLKSISNETLNESQIHVHIDMTNQQVGYTIRGLLTHSFGDFANNLLTSCNLTGELAGSPVHFEKPVYGTNEPTFTEFMAPGVLLTTCFFMAVGLTALNFIIERKEGLLDRSWIAGVTPAEVMFAHVFAQFVVIVIQVTFVLLFMLNVFSIPAKGSLILIVSLTLLQGICGMSFGLLISSMCTNEQDAIQVALGSFYPSLLLSGVVWPLEGMPEKLRMFSYMLPQTFACDAMRGILSRGWNLNWPQVSKGFSVTVIWTFVFLFFSVTLLRFRR